MNRNFAIAAATMGVAAMATSASAQIVFSEDFEDGNAASRWTVVSQQESTAEPTTGPDGSANLNYNYLTNLGILNTSGGATGTTGAFIQVNNTTQTGDQGESYSIFPTAFDLPSAPWRLDAEMYVFTGGGTTEFGQIGAFIDRNNPVSPYRYGTDGGPLAWGYAGTDGGGGHALNRMAEGGPGSTGYTFLNSYDAIPAGTIPGFETGITGAKGPSNDDENVDGSWVDVSLVSEGDSIGWYLNGVLMDTYDNSGGFYSTGEGMTFLLGIADPYNSVNAPSGVVIDNVALTVIPEPGSFALLGLGGLAMLRRRR